MSVRVKGSIRKYDSFDVVCPKCGKELEYTRDSIRIGRSYRNGYIVCPNCKFFVAHDERNLASPAEQNIQKLHLLSKDEKEKFEYEIKVFTILHHVFLPVGLVTMIMLPIIFILLGVQQKIDYNNSILLAVISFTIGLGLVISSRVFTTQIRNRREALEIGRL